MARSRTIKASVDVILPSPSTSQMASGQPRLPTDACRTNNASLVVIRSLPSGSPHVAVGGNVVVDVEVVVVDDVEVVVVVVTGTESSVVVVVVDVDVVVVSGNVVVTGTESSVVVVVVDVVVVEDVEVVVVVVTGTESSVVVVVVDVDVVVVSGSVVVTGTESSVVVVVVEVEVVVAVELVVVVEPRQLSPGSKSQKMSSTENTAGDSPPIEFIVFDTVPANESKSMAPATLAQQPPTIWFPPAGGSASTPNWRNPGPKWAGPVNPMLLKPPVSKQPKISTFGATETSTKPETKSSSSCSSNAIEQSCSPGIVELVVVVATGSPARTGCDTRAAETVIAATKDHRIGFVFTVKTPLTPVRARSRRVAIRAFS